MHANVNHVLYHVVIRSIVVRYCIVHAYSAEIVSSLNPYPGPLRIFWTYKLVAQFKTGVQKRLN